jgi:hypothetical protein
MGRRAHQAYRQLEQQLSEGPISVTFPTGNGTSEEVALSAEDLGFLTYTSLYTGNERMLLLRALGAYAGRDDLIPLVRLTQTGYGEDVSSVVYESVTCLDTSYPGKDGDEELAAISAARRDAEVGGRWFYEGTIIECPFWPYADHTRVPVEPFTGFGIPTLVVAAEGDPATPYADGLAVFESLDLGYLLTVTGGSHVMFGQGITCIDEAVTAFVVDGTEPARQSCDAAVISPYVPLLPASLAGYEISDLLWFADNELYYMPELIGWDWSEEMTVGCTEGGEVTFTGTETGVRSKLDECELADGLVLTGTGEWDHDRGTSNLEVSIGGDGCSYEYVQEWDDGSDSIDATCP